VTEREGARYRFGPPERSGVLGGWRPGQILSVAGGLIIGVAMLHVCPNVAGVAVAVAVLFLCVALATWPVSGRSGDEWLPVLVRWGSRGLRAKGRRSSDVLHGLRLFSIGRRDMGVVHDIRGRTLTAALMLRGQSFALLGGDEQDRRVAAWSSVLASMARQGSPIRRAQWLAASFPDEGCGLRHYVEAATTLDPASACVSSYEALLSDMDADTSTHDVVLTVQVRQGKSLTAACDVLEREVSALSRLLADADVLVDAVLSADHVAGLLARTFEAGGRRDTIPLGDTAPWPVAMEEHWDSLRVDGMWHTTFWVAEWPRTDVRSDFLAPLLLGSARATVSVVMEPLGPEQAVRRIEASRTADMADNELRRRSGFVATARHARQTEVLARREAELADGHASFRYAGFVTVSAPNEAELVRACDSVVQLAGQSRLVLRRLYGDQAVAYTCTLPLARGLR
jgi:hypothetical protein